MKLIKKAVRTVFCISAAAGVAAFADDQVKQIKETTSHRYNGPYEKYFKRPLDCAVATGALVTLSPVLLATAALVRSKLGSPVLFTQDRPGKDAKVFKLYKFRSMTDEKDSDGNLLPDSVRLTRFGRILRSTSLDELPELLNIIKGDMSLIGPRPLLIKYLPLYNEHQARRHEVRPGLTGLAQANGRNGISWEQKFDYDVEYLDNISFLGDIKVILATVKSVVAREGISQEGQATMQAFTGTPSEEAEEE